jgi:four helix bundle protein
MKISRFEDLEIWIEARILHNLIIELTSKEPFSKDFQLRNQIRASSGSIMDNIAEGFERGGNKEFIQFLSIAKGSCGETRSQSYRAFDAGHITNENLEELILQSTTISKKTSNLMAYLKKSEFKGTKYI